MYFFCFLKWYNKNIKKVFIGLGILILILVIISILWRDKNSVLYKNLDFKDLSSVKKGTITHKTLKIGSDVIINGYAPKGQEFSPRNLNHAMQTFEGYIYVFPLIKIEDLI